MGTRTSQGPPGWAEIARAVPAGSTPLRSLWVERRFIDAIGADERCLALRVDARLVTMAVAKQLARHASWTDGTTRPGRALVCALVGAVRGLGNLLSVTAFKEARRRLEAWGYLGTVRAGTTEQFRPMALRRGDPNEAPVYVLCLPRHPPKTAPRQPGAQAPRTLRPLTRLNQSHRPPARKARARIRGDHAEPATPALSPRAAAAANGRDGPADPAAAAAAAVAEVMRAAARQPISDRWCASISRPFREAAWTAADVAWALAHAPAGGRHRNTDPVRSAPGWLRYRLSMWLDDAGAALPSHRQELDERAAATRAEVDRWRSTVDELRAARTDARPHAARLRAQLGWA